MPAPKRIDFDKLREIDPVLAEHVQTALAREATKRIISIDQSDLEPARLSALGEAPVNSKGDLRASTLRSFGLVAYKWVRENQKARTTFLDFVTRLQGGISEPSEAIPDENPEREVIPNASSLWPRDDEGFVHCPVETCDFKSENVQSLVTHIGGRAQRDEAHASIETPSQKHQRERKAFYESMKVGNHWECTECHGAFAGSQGLGSHLSRIHGIEPPEESKIAYKAAKAREERREAAKAAQ